MLKRFAAILPCAAATASSAAGSPLVSSKESSAQAGSAAKDGLKVSVTFDAVKEFTKAVGGDRVKISTIIPDGAEPHDFEPKAQDLAELSTAKVFVYSGFGMESWADKAISSAGNPNLVTVEASKGAEPIQNTDSGEIKEHGQYDPHIWLSLKGAETEAENIKNGLAMADPGSRDYYEKDCDSFVYRLESLYSEYDGKFRTVSQKSFVTGHAAFGYLCRDFGLKQNSVEDVYAEGEPSAKQLAELVQYCRDHKVTCVFAEKMASPQVFQTLASEVGAKVETIYMMESGEDSGDYLERIESDLSRIYRSLGSGNEK